jgi:hypothetical protein
LRTLRGIYYLLLLCCYRHHDEEVRGYINISINNGDLVGTNKESIYVDPSVSTLNVTVFAKDAGHAVINLTLTNYGDNRYDIINVGLCNYTLVLLHVFYLDTV